ncbi:hypothetical protein LTR28_006527 [Elasticomyces elasticus]|nr:hypothetical protein LTR28_006527 [Elasticomyces elasticus]
MAEQSFLTNATEAQPPQSTGTDQERTSRSILIINPNSTASMTASLKPLVDALGFTETDHTYFTAPSGPASINNDADAAESAAHCLPHLLPLLHKHDGFLVACYSQHPLVRALQEQPELRENAKPVAGIFESSVAASLLAVRPHERFGIVSTGRVWEEILTRAVAALLGTGPGVGEGAGGARFAGVETTGLSAMELHGAPAAEVRRRMVGATRRLVRKGRVGAVCLGCAGMAGMNEMVREACVEELGEEEGRRVRIVDGVQAGVVWLEGALRSRY